MCGRNCLVIELVGKSGRDEGNGRVVADRNGMVESSGADRKERDVEHKESAVDGIVSDVHCTGSAVNGKESIVDGSRRDLNATINFTLAVTSQSSNILLSHGRSSLNCFNQEENWTSRLQHSSRNLILMSVMRMRSAIMIRFKSSTH